MKHFPRRALAAELRVQLQGKAHFGDIHNGLFLAAPRRTGKSTFLQSDLRPELEREGIVVVYVDLWSDQRRDPGELIAEAIGRVLAEHLGLAGRLAKASGLESVNVAGWLTLDTTKIGKPDGATLTDALRALRETSKRPVALIIDEAQHALTSDAGENAMAALKAARDQLNQPGNVDLMLIMSGSDRDKLLRLVNANGAPFYGSQVHRMPLLAEPFIEHVVSIIETDLPHLRPVDGAALLEAFQLFGSRPQFFAVALGSALNPLADHSVRFERRVVEAAQQQRRDDEAQMESDYMSLKPLERVILWRLLEQGPRFRPYDADALVFYRDKLGKAVKAQQAQAALESLRQRTPALVWKSARGEYVADDAAMHAWFEQRQKLGTWPPKGP